MGIGLLLLGLGARSLRQGRPAGGDVLSAGNLRPALSGHSVHRFGRGRVGAVFLVDEQTALSGGIASGAWSAVAAMVPATNAPPPRRKRRTPPVSPPDRPAAPHTSPK